MWGAAWQFETVDLAENVASEPRPLGRSGTSRVQILVKSWDQCLFQQCRLLEGGAGRTSWARTCGFMGALGVDIEREKISL